MQDKYSCNSSYDLAKSAPEVGSEPVIEENGGCVRVNYEAQ
jgi:hypothetical protein